MVTGARVRRGNVRALSTLLTLGLFALGAQVLASEPTPAGEGGGKGPHASRTKEGGEDLLIRRRAEWFYGPRSAGATERLADLRARAVDFTREAEKRLCLAGEDRGPDSTTAWTSRGPSSSNFGGWDFGKVAGRIPALAKDWTNNILYVGSASGGVWKSTNDGVSWTSIFDGAGTQTVGAITVDPSTPTTLWVGTGENTSYYCEDYFGIGLLRSTDGGATWEPRNGSGTLDLSVFCAVLVDPRNSNNLVVGGMSRNCVNGSYVSGGIYTTTDGGATWVKRLTGYATSVVRDPNNPDVLWAGVYYGGLYKSTNNGVTWVLQTASSLPSGTNARRTEVAVAPSDSNYVYVLFEYNGVIGHKHADFWQSTNGGTSWTHKVGGANACDGQCSYNMTLRVHPTTPATVYRGTIQLFRSLNGGSTWTNLTNDWGDTQKVHQDTHILLMNPTNGNEFYVGCDGGVWKTADGGASFTNLNANLNLTQFYAVGIHPTNDDIITGGAQDNSSLARTASDTWDVQEVTGDGFVSQIDPVTPDYVYITSYPYGNYPSLYRSATGVLGAFGAVPTTGITSTSRIEWVTPYDHAPGVSGTLFLGTYRMYKTTNRGTTWSPVGPADMTSGSGDIYTVNVCRTNGQYIYAGTSDSRVWQSVDGGSNWGELTGGLPARVINDIDADPTAPAIPFCVVSGFGTPHLYEWSGSAWVARGGGLPDVPANTVLVLSDTEVLVGNDVGIFRSTDRGQNFVPFRTGLPLGIVVTDLKYNLTTHTLTAGTYGRGAWQRTLTAPLEVAATEATALRWSAGSKSELTWGASDLATGYRIYRGEAGVLSALPAGATVCRAYQGAANATGSLLSTSPSPGSFFWYLVVATNSLGESSPGAGSATPRTLTGKAACATP